MKYNIAVFLTGFIIVTQKYLTAYSMCMFNHSLLDIIFVETSDLGNNWLNKSVALIFSICARLETAGKKKKPKKNQERK